MRRKSRFPPKQLHQGIFQLVKQMDALGEFQTFFEVKIWNHPIETSMYKQVAIRSQIHLSIICNSSSSLEHGDIRDATGRSSNLVDVAGKSFHFINQSLNHDTLNVNQALSEFFPQAYHQTIVQNDSAPWHVTAKKSWTCAEFHHEEKTGDIVKILNYLASSAKSSMYPPAT